MYTDLEAMQSAENVKCREFEAHTTYYLLARSWRANYRGYVNSGLEPSARILLGLLRQFVNPYATAYLGLFWSLAQKLAPSSSASRTLISSGCLRAELSLVVDSFKSQK